MCYARQLIQNVINETLTTLLGDGTFESMYEAGHALKQKHLDEENLIFDLKKNTEYVRELRIKAEEKTRLNDLEEKQRDELLYNLQVSNFLVLNHHKLNYRQASDLKKIL